MRDEHPRSFARITPADHAYPPLLGRRLGDQAPALHCSGPLPRRPGVAVVGTRAASRHSAAEARNLGRALAEAGYTVVSGGALGIDAAAHSGAPADTVAILGCGLDRPYPARNHALFGEIIAAGGAMVSPYAAGTAPRRFHFVVRNRLIAAWAEAVVVVEAGVRSGALNTARHARELGVPVFAFAGSPGTHGLLGHATKGGARRVAGADEVLAALRDPGVVASRRPPPSHPDERAVLAVLAALPGSDGSSVDGLPVERVAAAAALSLPRAAAALIRMQLDGRVRLASGGRYLLLEG